MNLYEWDDHYQSKRFVLDFVFVAYLYMVHVHLSQVAGIFKSNSTSRFMSQQTPGPDQPDCRYHYSNQEY